jgi:hypothetical protein
VLIAAKLYRAFRHRHSSQGLYPVPVQTMTTKGFPTLICSSRTDSETMAAMVTGHLQGKRSLHGPPEHVTCIVGGWREVTLVFIFAKACCFVHSHVRGGRRHSERTDVENSISKALRTQGPFQSIVPNHVFYTGKESS